MTIANQTSSIRVIGDGLWHNVSPYPTSSDSAHLLLRDAESFGNRNTLFRGAQYFSNNFIVQLCRRGLRASAHSLGVFAQIVIVPRLCFWWFIPTLPFRILHIVSIRSREKMVGASAWRIIAVVADELALRYWADKPFIRESMGGKHLPPRKTKDAVPVLFVRPGPAPAPINVSDYPALIRALNRAILRAASCLPISPTATFANLDSHNPLQQSMVTA
jgi:hypothetical protein